GESRAGNVSRPVESFPNSIISARSSNDKTDCLACSDPPVLHVRLLLWIYSMKKERRQVDCLQERVADFVARLRSKLKWPQSYVPIATVIHLFPLELELDPAAQPRPYQDSTPLVRNDPSDSG